MFANTPLTRIPILFDTLVVLLIWFVAVGIGATILRRLRVTVSDPWEHGALATALGLGLLSYLPFVLFAAHIGQARFIVGGLFAVGAVVWPDSARAVNRAARECRSALAGVREAPAWAKLTVVVLAVLLAVTFLFALRPPTDPDGLHYHLLAPLRYLQHSRFYYLPTYLHTNWPLGVEMLFAVGMAFNRLFAAGLIQYVCGLTLLLLTARIGARLGLGWLIWPIIAILFALINGEMTWAYVDLGLALFGLAALDAFLLGDAAFDNGDSASGGRWWLAAGLLGGLTATAKLTGILTVGVLALLPFLAASAEGRRVALGSAVKILAIGFVVALPWYVRSWILAGDPVYPYLGSIFHPRDWDAAAQVRLTEYLQVFTTLKSRELSATQVYEIRAVVALIVTVVTTILMTARTIRPIRSIVLFTGLSALLLIVGSGVYERYFLPLAPVALLIAFWVLRKPLQSAGAQWAAAVVALFILLGGPKAASVTKSRIAETAGAAKLAVDGGLSRDQYMVRKIDGYAVMNNIVNPPYLPSNAVVVMGLYEGIDALCERETLTTNVWTQNAIRFDTFEHTVADLKRLGATDLVWHPTPPPTGTMKREDALRHEREFAMLEQVKQKYGTLLATSNGYEVYDLNLPGAPPHKMWEHNPVTMG